MKKILITLFTAFLLCLGLVACECEHQYEAMITKDATCTEDGVKTFTCANCSDSYTEPIPKVSHTYTSKVTTPATCAKEGVETFTCTNCSDSYTEKLPLAEHKWVAATCSREKYCSQCKKSEGKALGHQLSQGKCIRCNHDEYSVPFTCAVAAITQYLLPRMKNPESLQIHSVKYCDKPLCSKDKCLYGIQIDYSGMNGFGGYTRQNLYVCLHTRSDGSTYITIHEVDPARDRIDVLNKYGSNIDVAEIKKAAGIS